LRDSGHALPLSPSALSSLALIGPGADQVIGTSPADGTGAGAAPAAATRTAPAAATGTAPAAATGTGPAAATGTGPAAATAGTAPGTAPGAASGTTAGTAAQPPGVLQALRQDLPPSQAAHLTFAVGDDMTGTPVPAAALTHDGQPGLDRSAAGHGAAQVVHTLDNTVAGHNALPAGPGYSWDGELNVPATGSYWISLGTGGSWDTLTLDGTVIARDGPGPAMPPTQATAPAPAGPAPVPTTDGLENLRAEVTLTAGIHTLGIAAVPDGSGRPVQARLDWVTPAQQQANLAAAVATARAASAAVVFAWSSGGATLPDGQSQLISDVAAVNPDTIVVLNTPGPVAMPWLGAVRAVLEMWYPGEAGGTATANVLLGRAGPAGRLPVTWPASPRRFRRNLPTGIFVGYRRYDRDGIAPLFSFGFGLSYTRFDYSALTWHAAPGGGVTVRLRVTNAGPRAGETVPQVYLGAPASAPPGVAFAPRALAAYTRIGLRPGESRVVTLTVPERQLQYWQDARGWVTAPGQRRLYVGDSERTAALTATVTVPR
jgi:beta-glucosidase